MELRTAPLPQVNAMIIGFHEDGMKFSVAVDLSNRDDIIATLVQGFMEAHQARHDYEQNLAAVESNRIHDEECEDCNGHSDQPSAVDG